MNADLVMNSSNLNVFSKSKPNIVVFVSQKLSFHLKYFNIPNFLQVITHLHTLFDSQLCELIFFKQF